MSGLWPLLWRAIAARPLRSALTVFAVSLGIAAVLGVQITIDSLDSEAAAVQRLTAGQSGLDVRVDSGNGLTAAQVSSIAGLDGVAQAVPLYEKRVVASPVEKGFTGLSVTLVGLSDGSAGLRPVDVVSGRLPYPGNLSEVAIDQGLAQALTARPGTALRLGDRIQLITSTGPDQYIVVGLTSGTSAGPGFTRSAVFVDDAAMLGTFRLGLRTPLVAVRLSSGASAAGVAAEVHRVFGQSVTTVDPRASGTAPLADLRPLLVLVTLLSVLIGAGVTANSAALAVLERRREIGLLRAAGGSAGQVFRLFAVETILVAACSVPVGLAGGVILGRVLGALYAPSGLPVPALAVGAGQVLAAIGAGLGAALIGGLLPALAAARLPVLTALRVHPEQGRPGLHRVLAGVAVALTGAAAACFLAGGSGAVAAGAACFLLAMVAAMPVAAPLLARLVARAAAPFAPAASTAAGNLARNRTRTAFTAAGVAISVAVAVAMSSLTAGALGASDSWVSHLFVGDTVLTSAVTQRDQVATALGGAPGIGSISELRIFSEQVSGSTVGIAAIDPSVFAAHDGLDVVSPDRVAALAALENGPYVLVPETVADASGWTVGTQLPVQTQKGVVYFSVAGIVAHSFPAGDGSEALIMASQLARTYFGPVATGFDDLLVFSSGSAATVADQASQYGLQAVSVASIAAAARSSLQRSIGLLLAMAVIAVVIAVLAVVNTLMVNVRQGTRELALLRAVGLARRHALRLVLAESGLLALSAALLGAAAGCVIALPMLAASASPGFVPAFSFPVFTAVALAGAVLVSALLATAGPARRATTASVLTALRQE